MKAITAFRFGVVWLVSVIVLVVIAVYLPIRANQRRSRAGLFSITDATGKIAGSVYWVNLEEAQTNRIDFVLLLPVAVELGGAPVLAESGYHCLNLRLKDGQYWMIETLGDLNRGTEYLRFHGLTGPSQTNYEFSVERRHFWKIAPDGKAQPLPALDPVILERVLRESRLPLRAEARR